MGNQAHAGEPIRRAVELVRSGIIGPVREVHCWTNRPIWPQADAALGERTKMAGQSKPMVLSGICGLDGYRARLQRLLCTVQVARLVGLLVRGAGRYGLSHLWTCHTGLSIWDRQSRWLPSPEAPTAETGPAWSTITYQFPARTTVGGGNRGATVDLNRRSSSHP